MGQHPGLTPPVPVAPAGPPIATLSDVPQWHVSINDVPVGPVRLEELGHKIEAGAVSEYSLVWRESFDEWRPLATVPELMALLHDRRHAGPPPRNTFSSMPPFVDSRSTSTEASVQTVISHAPAERFKRSEAPDGFVPLADSLQPEGALPGDLRDMSQPPAPIGPAGVFEPSPQLGSFSGLPAALGDDVSVPSTPPAAAAASAEPRRRASLGVLALLFAVIVLAGVVAFLMRDRLPASVLNDWLGNIGPAEVVMPVPTPVAPTAAEAPKVQPEAAEPEPAVEETPAEETPVEAEAREAEAETAEPNAVAPVPKRESAETEAGTAAAAKLVEPPNPADDPPKIAPAPAPRTRARRRARPAPVVEEASTEGSLSAEEQKILDEFGSSADTAPAKISVKKAGTSQDDKPPLDGDAVRATVTTNKPRLQRCYERAIRGQQSPASVRLDVSVTVAASGRVKDVSADGNGPGGLAACIEASVRRWRFPASSAGGPARFPIVFSAN
ncbi:MAG: GYF domain-containing protein [Polyangiales bacterium]